MANCGGCSGSGKCPTCKGKGTVNVGFGAQATCKGCNHSGSCTSCRGTGAK